MNNGLLVLTLGLALSLPLQAAPAKLAPQKAKKVTLLERAKKALPALVKAAAFGTASSIALDYSLKNFEILLPTKGEPYGQIRKTSYHLVGPIMAAIAYQLLVPESAEDADEYRNEPASSRKQ